MGWLRDYMSLVEPAIPSFGKLADLCLDHAQWPEESQPKRRSLSTLFSKLDREQDLDWLRDRLEIQKVLALLLARPVADIQLAIGEVNYLSNSRSLRLSDVRFARELLLTEEDLPPGIPRRAFTPPDWGFTWWIAPPGSGRSFTAAWLRARGLAHTATIRSPDDLKGLPPRGPLFLEFDSAVEWDNLDLTPENLSELRIGRRPLCVAAERIPESVEGAELLHSDDPTDFLPELVDWVEERLDGSGHFQADRAEQWMRRVALPAGAAKNFGDTLGLLGMIDEMPARSLLAKSLDEIAESFVRRRLREASSESSVSLRLTEAALPALQECAARVLVTGSNTLHSAHPVDEWTALLSSPENEELPDPEWFTSALRGALGSQISRTDLRRAARKLKPGAFQLAKSLEAARLLVRPSSPKAESEDRALRQLRPRWLVSLLSARASQEVLSMSAAGWGRVLLNGHESDEVVAALIQRAREGHFDAIFGAMEDFSPDTPELVAALEASIIACGLVSLEGGEVPDELMTGLLALEGDVLLVLGGMPVPRLTLDTAQSRLFHSTVFQIALLALERFAPLPHSALDPYRGGSEQMKKSYSLLCETALSGRTPLQLESGKQAVGLIDCLLSLRDSSENLESSCVLDVLEAWQNCSLVDLKRACKICPLGYLIDYRVQGGERRQEAILALWPKLNQLDDPSLLMDSPALKKEFWSALPLSLLKQRVNNDHKIEWSLLLPHQFAACLSDPHQPPLSEQAAVYCPIESALSHIEDRGAEALRADTLQAVFRRAAGKMAPLVRAALTAENSAGLAALLDAAPREASTSIAQGLPPTSELFNISSDKLEIIRLFLSRAVRTRHPGFDAVYEKLIALEAGLAPLRHLSNKPAQLS